MTNEEVIEKLKYCKSIHNGSFGPAIKIAIKALEQAPKTGHWEDCSNGWMCSECERDNREDTRYCPNCGAKMQEVEE